MKPPISFISVVSACYNEQDSLKPLAAEVKQVFAQIENCDYELIIVDDGSTDASAEALTQLVNMDEKVKVVQLSRNFGNPQYCYLAGMTVATGDAVIFIDADLQYPPALISQFIHHWRQGYQVVYGIRSRTQENFVRRIGYYFFYRIFQFLCSFQIPADAGDFGLMDRQVVNIILSLPEKDMFLRGLRAWVGFKQIGLPYNQLARLKGVSKFKFFDYVRTAKDAFVNFSVRPLELISYLAIGCACLTGFVCCLFFYLALTTNAPRGFFSLILTVLFLGTVQLTALGVLAEYLIRIFREVKGRPSFIIANVITHKTKKEDSNHE